MDRLQVAPLVDRDRILALPDRPSREAALLQLEQHRRDMVSHFLVMVFAKQLCEAAVNNTHEAVIAGIPASLVDNAKALARSHIKAARIVAASKHSGDYPGEMYGNVDT